MSEASASIGPASLNMAIGDTIMKKNESKKGQKGAGKGSTKAKTAKA